jgi:hypothetical protein
MEAHPEAMEAHPGAVEAHPGAVEAHPGAVEAHPGALEAHPGAVEAHPGALEAHAGIVEAYVGAMEALTGVMEAHLGTSRVTQSKLSYILRLHSSQTQKQKCTQLLTNIFIFQNLTSNTPPHRYLKHKSKIFLRGKVFVGQILEELFTSSVPPPQKKLTLHRGNPRIPHFLKI